MEPTTEQAPTPPPTKRPIWPFLLGLLIAIGGVTAWRVFSPPRGPVETPVVDAGAPVVVVVVAEVDAGPALSIDDGDALLKKLAAGWSADPLFAKWLDSLVLRQLVAATQLVAEGSSPRPALPFLSIAEPFAVREERLPAEGKAPREERVFIAKESYARFDSLAQVFVSIDAAAAGEAWSQLEPFCDVVFGEISRPGSSFHDTLTTAVKRLLAVQVPQEEPELTPKGAIYLFKDPALESLTPAQKHLVRMGPTNAGLVQAQLRAFATHAKLDVGP